MSIFTTEVRYICEMEAGLTESVGLSGVDSVIEKSYEKILGNYPLFDEAYRKTLGMKIIRHYYLREIAHETVGLWKFRLNTKLNEIMPYYNKLYESELLKFNPLYDVDLTTEGNRDGSGSSATSSENKSRVDSRNKVEGDSEGYRGFNESGKSEGSSEVGSTNENNTTTSSNTKETDKSSRSQTDRFSDTPQGGIKQMDLEENEYLTNARLISGSENGTKDTDGTVTALGSIDYSESGKRNEESERSGSEVTGDKRIENSEYVNDMKGSRNDLNVVNNTEDYVERVHGKRGGVSYAKMLTEFRDTLLNIDIMIINELEPLFFGLWE